MPAIRPTFLKPTFLSFLLSWTGLIFAGFVHGQDTPLTVVAFENRDATSVAFWYDEGGGIGLTKVETSGGTFSVDSEGAGVWNLSASEPFGVGRVSLSIDRTRIAGDLALVLVGDYTENGDFVIQLFDAAGAALAIDLFGQTGANMKAAGTDTLIIPLMRYPEATRIDLRRIEGTMAFRSFWLMPVMSELEGSAKTEAELADALGERLAPDRSAPSTALRIPSLETISEIGAAALSEAGYPRFSLPGKPTASQPRRDPIKIPVSGTAYELIQRAERVSRLSFDAVEAEFSFLSSYGVHRRLENILSADQPSRTDLFEIGFSSIPVSQNQKAIFLEKMGYPLIEFPIARSVIEVLVHEKNPLEVISYSQLLDAFGKTQNTQTWGDLGVTTAGWADVPLSVFGGAPKWGTSKVFNQLALGGEGWREGMDHSRDVVFPSGVEAAVGQNIGGIGYATQRKRVHPVKALAILATDGTGPIRPDESSIYSGRYPFQRKLYAFLTVPSIADASPEVQGLIHLLLSANGQAMVVEDNNLPLALDEILDIRSRIGL